ncbi:MAG TPA: hypothetical protein PJ982_03180 [Lacipirellulaceae bacterium]|nr:hypothetical protein [Lacipirellulaceae bacterium]
MAVSAAQIEQCLRELNLRFRQAGNVWTIQPLVGLTTPLQLCLSEGGDELRCWVGGLAPISPDDASRLVGALQLNATGGVARISGWNPPVVEAVLAIGGNGLTADQLERAIGDVGALAYRLKQIETASWRAAPATSRPILRATLDEPRILDGDRWRGRQSL